MESVARAFDGAWGAFVNTDGFTVGEQRELWAGIKIFETARRTKSMRHYVWSSIAYMSKVGRLSQSNLIQRSCSFEFLRSWVTGISVSSAPL